MAYNFNAKDAANNAVQWIIDWFNTNGKDMNVVIGMSGGKDSTITAALLARALGPQRVIGVSLPEFGQGTNEADKICDYLGIRYMEIPIGNIVKAFSDSRLNSAALGTALSVQAEQNIPPRVRMSVMYALAQSNHAFVVNNCNLSEDYIGYATKFGDAAGDFSVLSDLTVTEILQIGDYLGLPYEWVHKTPDDGLPHSSADEVKFGFTYAELDKYIRENIEPTGYVHNNPEEGLIIDKIKNMHKWNLHKLLPMPKFNPNVN